MFSFLPLLRAIQRTTFCLSHPDDSVSGQGSRTLEEETGPDCESTPPTRAGFRTSPQACQEEHRAGWEEEGRSWGGKRPGGRPEYSSLGTSGERSGTAWKSRILDRGASRSPPGDL